MLTYHFGDPAAPVVLIQPVDDHDLAEIRLEQSAIRELTGADFRLTAVKVDHWNRDLSPWPAPPAFGKEGFGDGAEEFLKEVLELCGDPEKTYYIGGYSLAGLFALWAACRTDRFQGVAAASPSVWFPGFTDWLKENRMQAKRVYLSLGDREERTRNPVMAAVGDRIRETCELLKGQGISCTLEWNPGNHFADAGLRTAKDFAWVIGSER